QANAPPRRTRTAAANSPVVNIDRFFMCSASLRKMPGYSPVRQDHTPGSMKVPFSQSAGTSRKVNLFSPFFTNLYPPSLPAVV
ncbi:MAG TPA: hypothetical protein PK008_11080, partial [Aminivibrio sp.]|uniref:hypothetical protein n=1 Tax=Aminivibrio sp. TaxID=1872489 RepID=UPI002C62BC73